MEEKKEKNFVVFVLFVPSVLNRFIKNSSSKSCIPKEYLKLTDKISSLNFLAFSVKPLRP